MRNRMVWLFALPLASCGAPGGGENRSSGQINGAEILPLPADANGFASEYSIGNAVGPTAQGAGDYLSLAGAGDRFEIESATIAMERTRRDDVRELATMIERDHRMSTSQLQQAAAAAGQRAPAQPALSEQQQQMLQTLRDAQPDAVDALYLQQQIQAHQQTLALARTYARTGEVSQLRQHAQTIISPVEMHLQRARQLATH